MNHNISFSNSDLKSSSINDIYTNILDGVSLKWYQSDNLYLSDSYISIRTLSYSYLSDLSYKVAFNSTNSYWYHADNLLEAGEAAFKTINQDAASISLNHKKGM